MSFTRLSSCKPNIVTESVFKCTAVKSVSDDWDKINIYIKAGFDGKQWNIDEITHPLPLRMLPMYHSQNKYHIIT